MLRFLVAEPLGMTRVVSFRATARNLMCAPVGEIPQCYALRNDRSSVMSSVVRHLRDSS